MAAVPLARFWRWTARFSARRARPILVAAIATTLVFGAFLLRIETDTDLDAFIRPEAQALVDTIEEDFDQGEVLTLIFESRSERSLLEPDLLHRQLRILKEINDRYEVDTFSLVEGIDAGLKRVKRKSLLDFHDYSPIAEGILGLAGGRTVRDLEKVSRHFLSHPEAIAFYTKFRLASAVGPSSGGPGARETRYAVPFVKAVKALVQLDPDYSNEEKEQVLLAIPRLAHSMGMPEFNVYGLNDQLTSYELDQSSRQNAYALGLIVLLVDSLCIWLLFRSRRELGLVLSILAMAAIWTFGAGEMFGLRFSFFHLVALPILLGTGIDDTLVFSRRLAEERAKGKEFEEALVATFEGVGNAIFLTTFTTLLAFLVTALTATTYLVLSFFLFVALSMLIVFVLSTFLQGAIRAELVRWDAWAPRPGVAARASPFDHGTRAVTRLSGRLLGHHRGVLLVSGVLMLLAMGSTTQISSELKREDFMRPSMQAYAALKLQRKYFGDSRIGYVLISGDVENPLLLVKLRQLEESLTGHPDIEQVLRTANVDSIVGLFEKLRIPITPETDVRTAFDRISASELTANYVLDETFREAREHVLRKTGDRYDGLLMRFVAHGDHFSEVVAAFDAIEGGLEALGFDEIPGIDSRVGGGDAVLAIETRYYVDLLLRSFFVSLVATWLLLFVAWRRARLALIAMAPVVLAITVLVGIIPLAGLSLSLLTAAIGSVAVGLGIDYPIHIIERFEEECRGGRRSRQEAMSAALGAMGPHILASALTTVVGFGAACVMALPLAVSFGLLTGAAIALVYLASMFMLPSLLVRYGL